MRNATAGLTEMIDAYEPVPLSDSASVSALAGAVSYWAHALPYGSVLSEVGIAAQSGAYAHPWELGSKVAPIKRQIQANWFSAQCQAVVKDQLGGIYFWPLYFGQSFPDKTVGPTAWAGTPGANAIAPGASSRYGGELVTNSWRGRSIRADISEPLVSRLPCWKSQVRKYMSVLPL